MKIDGVSIIEYNVELLRDLNRWSMIDTAEKLGVSIEEYYKLETDAKKAHLITLFKVAAFYSVPVSMLMSGKLDAAKLNSKRA